MDNELEFFTDDVIVHDIPLEVIWLFDADGTILISEIQTKGKQTINALIGAAVENAIQAAISDSLQPLPEQQ